MLRLFIYLCVCLAPLAWGEADDFAALNAKIQAHSLEQKRLETQLREQHKNIAQHRRAYAQDIQDFNAALRQTARIARQLTPLQILQKQRQTAVLRFRQKHLTAHINAQEEKLEKLLVAQSKLNETHHTFLDVGKRLKKERDTLLKKLNIKSTDLAKRLNKVQPSTLKSGLKSDITLAKGRTVTRPTKGKVLVAYNSIYAQGLHAKGVTLQAKKGGIVRAASAGKVLYTGNFRTYGGLMIIGDKKGQKFIYGGLKRYIKNVGDSVSVGTRLAYLPNESLPPLYFEVRGENGAINPKKWLK